MTVKSTARAGFTLVELSIVLVIVGLLTGGVLVGQDLIQGAKIKQTIRQVEEVNTAALAFRGKYLGLPGDLISTTANALGLVARTGAAKDGNGNGLVENPIAWSGIVGGIGKESLYFWSDLTKQGFLPGAFPKIVNGSVPQADVPDAGPGWENYLPLVKIRDKAFMHIGNDGASNYIVIGHARGYNAFFGGVFYMNGAFTPLEAEQIDTKMDDGVAATGNYKFTNSPIGLATSGPALPQGCVDAAGIFNLADAYNSDVDCVAYIKASF